MKGGETYQWIRRDKILYALSMLPFVLVFIGTAYLLSRYSILLTVILVGLYLFTNVFQAGCCIGCPYQGKYCPALCGVYLGNWLSGFLYKNRNFDQKFFDRNAKAGEILLTLTVLFPIYWIFLTAWYLVPIYLGLLAAHFLIFMPTQCEKCGYQTICPGGQTWLGCRKWLGFRSAGKGN
jgi:hypothetical protein